MFGPIFLHFDLLLLLATKCIKSFQSKQRHCVRYSFVSFAHCLKLKKIQCICLRKSEQENFQNDNKPELERRKKNNKINLLLTLNSSTHAQFPLFLNYSRVSQLVGYEGKITHRHTVFNSLSH